MQFTCKTIGSHWFIYGVPHVGLTYACGAIKILLPTTSYFGKLPIVTNSQQMKI
jgi:hypothetical protein